MTNDPELNRERDAAHINLRRALNRGWGVLKRDATRGEYESVMTESKAAFARWHKMLEAQRECAKAD